MVTFNKENFNSKLDFEKKYIYIMDWVDWKYNILDLRLYFYH